MSGHGHIESGSNKRVALLIAVLALCLAVAETLGKGAQTKALSYNIEASNLWAFFQAKTIRQTTVRTASEMLELERSRTSEPAVSDALGKRIDTWGRTIARWESEPDTNEGRRELMVRAKVAEQKRDDAMAKYHHYEMGSAAFQIAIVLASAAVITGIAALTWLAMGGGVVGLAFSAVGLWAPNLFHIL